MSAALREAHPSTPMALESKRSDDSVEFRESNSAIWGQEASFRRQLDRLRDATVVLVSSAFTSWESDKGSIQRFDRSTEDIVGSEEAIAFSFEGEMGDR